MNNYDEIWNSISLFYSASTTQKYLQTRYQMHSLEDSNRHSFENCQTFMHYLEYAQTYYKESQTAPLSIKPILLFYGYIQLMKACLLTVDPHYPDSSSLLAHGVSTRKRKKQQYEFLNDEIKIQKKGLFGYLNEKIFRAKTAEGEKICMSELITQLPELHHQLNYFNRMSSFPLIKHGKTYLFSSEILNSVHMTVGRFQEYLQQSFQLSLDLKEEQNRISFTEKQPFSYNYHQPFRYNILNDHFHLCIQKESICTRYGEMLIHYLLLYNLSMIARYETDWWLDLLKTSPNEDFPIIQTFLNITSVKGPFLVSNWLLSEHQHLYI